MKTRTTLYADEGMILTDGEHFGKIVHLEIGADAKAWYEITQKRYEELLKAEEEKAEQMGG
jgi:hypothetical protein